MGDTGHSGGRLSGDETALFSEQIAGIASAGLPLGPGLRATAEEMPRGRLRSTLLEVASALEAGAPLDEVIAGAGNRLPGHLRGLVELGQKTNRLGPILSRFVSFMNVGIELRRRLWINLAYPVLALILALAIFAFVCSTLVVSFEQIFRDFGVPLPAFTILLLRMSRLLSVTWRPLAELACAVLVLTILSRVILGPAQRRSLVSGVPVLGQVWRNTSLAEFCQLLALLLESEIPLPEAARLTGEGVCDATIDRACRGLGVDLEGGLPLSDAIGRNPVFPRGLARLLKWAEGHQSLPASLRMAGDMFEARARSQANFAGTVLGVLAVISVILGVAWLVLALFLPLISLISRLSG